MTTIVPMEMIAPMLSTQMSVSLLSSVTLRRSTSSRGK